MELTYAQKEAIFRNGFVKVPGVVPQVMVEAALRGINNSVGEGMNADEMVTFRSRSYCPELQGSPIITDLLNRTPAWELAESAIGVGKIIRPKGGQIALRFPSMQDPPPKPGGHLDGMHSPHNGVPQGVIRNFTMLVAVYLSHVPEPYSGNFTVWPGTHHVYEKYFQEHGPESLLGRDAPGRITGATSNHWGTRRCRYSALPDCAYCGTQCLAIPAIRNFFPLASCRSPRLPA